MKLSITPVLLVAALLSASLPLIAQSLDELRAKAEAGNAIAQEELGKRYIYGGPNERDPKEGLKWLSKAAEQGNADAQYTLGTLYSLPPQFSDLYGVATDYAEALKWLRIAAAQGHAGAQESLGGMYELGQGVAKDDAEAVRWYLKAARQGDASAEFFLAQHFLNGTGVSRNPIEAGKWYRKAAEQGHAPAELMLGVMYANGDGMLKDEIEALAWFNVCASNPFFKEAVESRDAMERSLGHQATLVAQQRSEEILKLIESKKAALTAGSAAVPSSAPASKSDSPKASGSGAIISTHGVVLTAAHVVADATRLKVITAYGTYGAKVIRSDEANDLAVLEMEPDSSDSYAAISTPGFFALPIGSSRDVRLGQSVSTIGFPNVDIQGFSPKVTRGEISSLNGIADDPRSWQISVPVQPGNSGGPLLDENGNLIGVVVAKLGLKAAKVIGDMPQNVNYAIKSAYALPLLEPYLGGDAPEPNQPKQKPSFEDMVSRAQQSVVLILCY
jgi:S1-C subfamily serine protease